MGRGGKKPRVYPKPPLEAREWLFHVKDEPVPITPSQSSQCPLPHAISRIVSREESQDGHCDVTYIVEIKHRPDNAARTREEITLVDVTRILDYVSPRELERFENADFRRMTEAEKAAYEAAREEEARQRLARNYRPKPGKNSAAPAATEAHETRGRPPESRGSRGRGRGRGRGRPRGRGGLAFHNNTKSSNDIASLDGETETPPIEPFPGSARTTNLEEKIGNDTESVDIEPPPGFRRVSQNDNGETEMSEEDEVSAPPPELRRGNADRHERDDADYDGYAPARVSRVLVVTDDEDDEEDEFAQVGQDDRPDVDLNVAQLEEDEQDALAAGQLEDEEGIAPPPGFHRVPHDDYGDYDEDDNEDDDELEESPHPSSQRSPKSAKDGKKRPTKNKEPRIEHLTNHYAPGFHQLTPAVPAKEKPNLKKWRQTNLFNIKNAVPGFLKFQFISNSALPSTSKRAASNFSVSDSDEGDEEILESAEEDEEDEVIKAKDVPAEYVEYDESSDSVSSRPHQSQLKSSRQGRSHNDASNATKSQTQNAGAESNGHRHKRRRTESVSRPHSVHDRSSLRPTGVVPIETGDEASQLDGMDNDEAADNEEQEDVYVVEKVLSHQIDRKGKTWYLVKWEGYEETEDWLAEEDLAEASDVVSQYHADLKSRGRKQETNGTVSKRRGR